MVNVKYFSPQNSLELTLLNYFLDQKKAQIPVEAAQPAIVEQPVSLEVLDFGTCRSQKKLK